MKKVLLSLAAVALGFSGAYAVTATYDATAQNYSNQQDITTGTAGAATITFDKGKNSNGPKYYTSGNAIRVYGENTITVSVPEGSTLTQITYTFGATGDTPDKAITANVGTFNSPTWTGSSNSVVFTVASGKGNRRIAGLTVTYTEGQAPAVSLPAISCVNNMVTITCDTPDAEIYYTTDGTTPSKSSTLYSNPFEITKNVTVKAIAYKGNDASDVQTFDAVYNVQGEISVAEAISLIDGGYTASAQVKGYITSIEEVSTNYGNATYLIADDMNATNTLKVFRGYWLDGQRFTSQDQIEVGAQVVVEGNLTLYNSEHEMASGNKILSYTAPQVEYVKTPVFNPESGMVEAGTEVTITCETEGASIYYTTDGTTPTVESTLYTAPIAVNSAMTITAIAAKEGMVNSEVASASYTLYNPNEKFVTFDFTDTTWLQNEGVEIPTTASTGTDVAGKSFTVVPVTFAIADNSEKVQARIWKATSGTVHLRMYTSDSFTISSTENFKLMSVEFTPVSTSNFGLTLAQGSEGTLDNTTWNAPDSKTVESVKFGISKNSYINSVKVLYDVVSGVENIESEENVAPVYYNLQGVRVANPQNGLYIQVKGGKSSKVLVK